MKFKIGDKVSLSKNSRYFGEYANPSCEKKIGTVCEFLKKGLPIRVDWDGYRNSYGESDLKLAIPNNKLSRVMYPDFVPTDCGNYLKRK